MLDLRPVHLAPKDAQEAEISVGIAFKHMNVQRYVLVAAQCLQLLHGHPEVDRVRRLKGSHA